MLKLKKVHQIVGYVLVGIIVATIVFFGVYLIKKAVNKDKPTYMFNYAIYRVETGSMEKTIPMGSLIVVKKVDQYQVDMIVTFKFPNEKKPTTHRIVGIDPDTNFFETKGDNNNSKDPSLLNPEYIIGAHVLTWKNYDKVTSPIGIIIIGIIGFLLIDGYFTIGKLIDKKIEKANIKESETDVSEIEENKN